MKKYFTNKHTKERRLIWFAGKDTPEAKAPAPAEDADTPDPKKVEKTDDTPEKVGKAEDPNKLDDSAAGGAKNKVEDAAKGADENAEALAKEVLDIAQLQYDVTAGVEGPEAALAEANQGENKYTLEDGKLKPVEAPKEDSKDEDEAKEGGEDDEATDESTDESTEKVTETLSKSDQEFIDATITQMTEELGMTSENAKDLAMALLPIHRAIQSFKNGPEGSTTDETDETSGEKTDEKADDKAGDDKEEGGDASGDVVDESADKLDPTTVQNPKEEADKIREDAEKLTTRKAELNTEDDELNEDDLEPEERKRSREIMDELDEIDKGLDEIEAKAVPFDEELERRANIVDTTWQNASEGSEDGLISGVALDTADGDDLLITIKDPTMVATVTAIAESFGVGVSVNKEGSIVIEDVPHGLITGEGPLNALMDALAAIPAPAVSDDAEDKEDTDEGSESKERSPEVIADALNAQLEVLRLSNPDFMKEAPIGRVFAAMSYEPDGKGGITIDTPASVSAEYRAIMKANGRDIVPPDGEDYTVEYPDGTKIEMAGDKPGKYPSRLAWGGTEGNAESQFSAAEAGMNMWKSSISADLPDNITMVEPSGEEPVLDGVPEGDDATKMKIELASLQGSLGEHAGDSHFGKFIASLDVGSSEGATVLTSKGLMPEQFSHMYEQIGLGDKVASLTESASGGYVMVLKEGAGVNIVHNLGRWAAMMGSKVESGSESEGDLGSGTEVAKSDGEPAPDSGEDENLLDESRELSPDRLAKLKDWEGKLNARAVQLDYKVTVELGKNAEGKPNGLLVVRAMEGDNEEEGMGNLKSIEAEAIPRAIGTVLSEDAKSLTLDIDRRTDDLGYLGKGITDEEFRKTATDEEINSPSLGADAEGAPDTLSGPDKTEDAMQKLRDLVGAVEGGADPKTLDAPIAAVRDAIGDEEAFHASGNSDPAENIDRQVILDGYKANMKEYESLYAESPDSDSTPDETKEEGPSEDGELEPPVETPTEDPEKLNTLLTQVSNNLDLLVGALEQGEPSPETVLETINDMIKASGLDLSDDIVIGELANVMSSKGDGIKGIAGADGQTYDIAYNPGDAEQPMSYAAQPDQEPTPTPSPSDDNSIAKDPEPLPDDNSEIV